VVRVPLYGKGGFECKVHPPPMVFFKSARGAQRYGPGPALSRLSLSVDHTAGFSLSEQRTSAGFCGIAGETTFPSVSDAPWGKQGATFAQRIEGGRRYPWAAVLWNAPQSYCAIVFLDRAEVSAQAQYRNPDSRGSSPFRSNQRSRWPPESAFRAGIGPRINSG